MKKFSVKVNPEESRDLQLFAFENGYDWECFLFSKKVLSVKKEYLHFNVHNDFRITHSESDMFSDRLVSISDAKRLIKGDDVKEEFKPTHEIIVGSKIAYISNVRDNPFVSEIDNYVDNKCKILYNDNVVAVVKTEYSAMMLCNLDNLKPISEVKEIKIEQATKELSELHGCEVKLVE